MGTLTVNPLPEPIPHSVVALGLSAGVDDS